MTNISCVFVVIGVLFPLFLKAQNEATTTSRNDSSFIEIAGFGATDGNHLPFWLHTNQWGTVPKSGRGASLRAGWAGSYSLTGDKKNGLRFNGGIQAVQNITKEQKFLLPEVYAGLSLGKFEIFAGRKRQTFGLADSTIGSGSYAVSGNSMPHFRVQFGFFEYTSVPFTKGWLQFLATYSDGVMDKDRPVVQDLNLHQKQLYIRLGNPKGWLRLYGGANHMAQWGGKSPYFLDETKPADKQMPKTFDAYWDVVTGHRGPQSSNDQHDATNRIGNHLGTIDLGMEIRTYGADFFLYRQNIYEDGSLYSFINIADGLNGVRLKRKNIYGAAIEIHEAVVEFLYTKSQGGDIFIIDDPKRRGRDNYFNNYQVRDGWSYQARTIGTPFITPGVDTRHLGQNFIYGDAFSNNSRVWVTHLGLKGRIANRIQFTTKLSYSRNFGVYDMSDIWPEEGLGQFSGLISLRHNTNWIGGMSVGLNLAMDYGDLYPTSYGGMLSLRKPLNF